MALCYQVTSGPLGACWVRTVLFIDKVSIITVCTSDCIVCLKNPSFECLDSPILDDTSGRIQRHTRLMNLNLRRTHRSVAILSNTLTASGMPEYLCSQVM